MEKANKEAKPFVELFYWFVVFFLLGLLSVFSNHHRRPPIDYDAMDTNTKIGHAIGLGVGMAIILSLLNALRRWLFRKMFD